MAKYESRGGIGDFWATLQRGGRRLARLRSRIAVGIGGAQAAEPKPWDPTPTFMAVAADAHRDFLRREASADELAAWGRFCHEDGSLWEDLQAMHRSDSRFESIVRPVVAEIQTVYQRFLFREPNLREIVGHWGRFRAASADEDDDGLAALRRGEARRRLGIRPFHLEMDVVNQCNIRCVMCHFSLESVSKHKKKELSVEDFTRIADQLFPLCEHVSLSFNAEPLLHRRIGEILDVAGRYGVPGLYLITNAMLLDAAKIERIVRGGVSLCVSVDSATRETYERIRVGARFDRLLTNLRTLREARREAGAVRRGSGTQLHLNFVLMRSNVRELPAFVRLADELEASSVGAVHLVPYEGIDMEAETLDHDKPLCNAMLREAHEVGQSLGLPTYFPAEFDLGARAVNGGLPILAPMDASLDRVACRFPWRWIGLQPDGLVRPCGWWYDQPPMGDLRASTFEEIWNGEPYRRLREEHLANRLRETCLTCPAAGMGDLDGNSAFRVKRHFLDA